MNGAGAPLGLEQVLAIVGPTASGKSDVAFSIAQRLVGEIISVDSMQVYRGMDIGTAKPAPEQRAQVPHHLIDVADISQPFDAAQFVSRAREAVAGVQQRRRLPILCGGTGLYLRALLEGLGESPPASPDLRAELEATPLPVLLNELAARDPQTASQIDSKNPRRVIRAVEVVRLTGKPYSLQRAKWDDQASSPAMIVGLLRERSDLVRRIDERVERMFERGLVAETKALLDAGLRNNRTALQALGYRQVVEHLQGSRSYADTVEVVKVQTRRFAKRQMTWFKRQCSVNWITVEAFASVDEVSSRVLETWERHQHLGT